MFVDILLYRAITIRPLSSLSVQKQGADLLKNRLPVAVHRVKKNTLIFLYIISKSSYLYCVKL